MTVCGLDLRDHLWVNTVEHGLLRGLVAILGRRNVLVDDELTARYRSDWTGRFHSAHGVVVRPADAAEVSQVVELCRREAVAIVPQGGNTGLVGGGVAMRGEIVLSTERMTGAEEAFTREDSLVVAAGTTLGELQRRAGELGRTYAVDIASRDSATVGGTVATNAGGLHVVRYGPTRRQVTGVELVTGAGEVISSIGGPRRDNTGYDLASIVTGSEGTLGVITRVQVRLVPAPARRVVALMRFASVSGAMTAAEAVPTLLDTVEAVEVFLSGGLRLVCSAFGLSAPFEAVDAAYLLVEVASDDDPVSRLGEVVGSLVGVEDVAVAQSAVERARLWRYRELHTDAIATLGVAHKLDVAVPPGSLAAFAEQAPEVVQRVSPDATSWLFGHGGESCLHMSVTGADPQDSALDDALLNLVADLDGSISAEHGIGRARLPWIHLAHDEATLRAFAGVKAAFDPDGLMNPGVLLPPR